MSSVFKLFVSFYITLTLVPLFAFANDGKPIKDSLFENGYDNQWVRFTDSISGLTFLFPDTPNLNKPITGGLKSYSITYTEPGVSYIVEIDSIDLSAAEDRDSILLASIEKLLDNRAKIIDYTLFDHPIPHIHARVTGRYATYLNCQAFIYNNLLVRQVLLKLGDFEEKAKVRRFFKSF